MVGEQNRILLVGKNFTAVFLIYDRHSSTSLLREQVKIINRRPMADGSVCLDRTDAFPKGDLRRNHLMDCAGAFNGLLQKLHTSLSQIVDTLTDGGQPRNHVSADGQAVKANYRYIFWDSPAMVRQSANGAQGHHIRHAENGSIATILIQKSLSGSIALLIGETNGLIIFLWEWNFMLT